MKFTDEEYIAHNESERLEAYQDTRGVWTIGFGQTGPWVVPGLVLDHDHAVALLQHRVAQARLDASWVAGDPLWASLDPCRRVVCTDLAYQLGREGWAGFHDTVRALKGAEWQAAHDALLASQYAQQTPGRANRNALVLLTGEPPTGWEP